MINTQLTHLHNSCMDNNDDWYKHQVTTACNYSIGSPFAYIFSGGLNYQIEHHLFPNVNHCHHSNLQPIVKEVCDKHKVKYKSFKGYFDAFISHCKYIISLGYH